MKKREILLLSALTFSVGTIFGFLISPVKKGLGNGCGNTTNNNYYGEQDKEENELVDETCEKVE